MEYPQSPAALPDALLTDPRLRKALQLRDFGAVFAVAHEAAEISYNKIAEACGLKAERVGKLARGDGAVTTLASIERIADGLRIPGRHLGLAARPWESPNRASPARMEDHDGDDRMKRRNLLRGALAAGLTGAGATALTAARQDLDSALDDHQTADLPYWESTAERYGYGYNGKAPTKVLSDLVLDFDDMKPLFRQSQTVKSRGRLCHVTAQMAGMTAIVLHDLGDHREAHAWFHTARRAAGESGDTGLHAWALAREAMVPLNFGAPAAAANLADQSRHLAGGQPSAAAALACAVAARAYAAQGNRDAALAAVSEAEHLTDRLTPQQAADTWFGYPEQKHHVHLSQALTILGETKRAYATQSRALELSRSPSLMTRALISIDRASCLAHDGEPEEAARVAAQAFGELPPAYRTGLTRTRALALYRIIRTSPGAGQLRDVLDAPTA
ncbi:hypothetical protein [Streptomyces sp. 769]|uniref:hypothetical protein n=1 Tax=Streptomyces sp. 769 TaxID=1262452 RepID=UPI00057F867A|nr:hypothetical protein [Streptomyces sp. 769]AJC58485.1 hypothetical protein GZL_05910 [Streptomyces sp. 769]